MQNKTATLLIFIGSVIIGILICFNFGIIENKDFFSMDTIEYRDAVDIRNRLYRDIEALKIQNREVNSKINSYNYYKYDHEKVILDMENQLNDYNLLAGVNEGEGEGVVIKIEDGNYNLYTDPSYEIDRKTLHDIDLAMVLNELRSIGAEAISVNDYRVSNNTGVECDWAFVIFNQRESTRQAQPFYFYVIGNSEELKVALEKEGSYLNKLKIRGLKISIKKDDNIKIIKRDIPLDIKYMERIN